MEIIKDIVADVIKGINEKKVSKDDPESILKRILSKKELSHVKFRYLRKGVLGIAVDSTGWLYQLNLQKPKLMAKLGGKLQGIKDLRFYMGEIE